MNDNKAHFSIAAASPLYQLIISFLTIIAIGIVLFVISFIAGVMIFRVELSALADNLLTDAGNADIAFLRYLLIMEQICFFIIPSVYLLKQMKGSPGNINLYFPVPSGKEAVLVILLAFCLFPVTGFMGELNSGLHLPEWLSGIETWMTKKENEADSLLAMISAADTFGVMMLNLIIIALLPAIGEEMIFRGIFQRIFQRLFRNDHLGIWFIAFIFSAIHLQFFGFIPRFILGLAFGYLYYWGGTLWLPILAHFVNNAVPTVSAYLGGLKEINTQPDTALWIQMLILPAPIVIAVMILLYFRRNYISR
jgi:membrane protease YdiL (CAAX protease family)